MPLLKVFCNKSVLSKPDVASRCGHPTLGQQLRPDDRGRRAPCSDPDGLGYSLQPVTASHGGCHLHLWGSDQFGRVQTNERFHLQFGSSQWTDRPQNITWDHEDLQGEEPTGHILKTLRFPLENVSQPRICKGILNDIRGICNITHLQILNEKYGKIL